MSVIIQNIIDVESRIEDICSRLNISRSAISLVVVSKTQTSSSILEAIGYGLTDIGENKLQEAEAKMPLLPSSITWHFIGRLQHNKVNKVIRLFDVIHSVDSLKLAQNLDQKALDLNKNPLIFLQVNLSKEQSKNGFEVEQLHNDLPHLIKLKNINISGLMCIPPIETIQENSRKWFRMLRFLRDSIEIDYDIKLPYLSMGMSDDFLMAIEEGATHVRVGSAIFGKRQEM